MSLRHDRQISRHPKSTSTGQLVCPHCQTAFADTERLRYLPHHTRSHLSSTEFLMKCNYSLLSLFSCFLSCFSILKSYAPGNCTGERQMMSKCMLGSKERAEKSLFDRRFESG